MKDWKDFSELIINKLKSQKVKFIEEDWVEMEKLLDREIPINSNSNSNPKGGLTTLLSFSLIALIIGVNSERISPDSSYIDAVSPPTFSLINTNALLEKSSSFIKEDSKDNNSIHTVEVDLLQNLPSNSINAFINPIGKYYVSQITFNELTLGINHSTTPNEEDEVAILFASLNPVNGLMMNSTKNELIESMRESFNIYDKKYSKRTRDLSSKRHYAEIILGTTANSSAPYFSNSTDKFFGVKFSKTLTTSISASTGIIHKTIGLESFNLSETYEVAHDIFGMATQIQSVSPNRLYMVEMPISAQVNLGDRHLLYSGMNLAYVYTSSFDVTNSSSETQETQTQWGNDGRFNSVSMGLHAGYKIRLEGNLSAGMEYTHGLSDLTNNEFYSNSEKSFERNLKISIAYRLINF